MKETVVAVSPPGPWAVSVMLFGSRPQWYTYCTPLCVGLNPVPPVDQLTLVAFVADQDTFKDFSSPNMLHTTRPGDIDALVKLGLGTAGVVGVVAFLVVVVPPPPPPPPPVPPLPCPEDDGLVVLGVVLVVVVLPPPPQAAARTPRPMTRNKAMDNRRLGLPAILLIQGPRSSWRISPGYLPGYLLHS